VAPVLLCTSTAGAGGEKICRNTKSRLPPVIWYLFVDMGRGCKRFMCV
jgi:hypothetical protein